MEIFQYRLKEMRIKRKFTQEELGKRIYTSKASICQYENGRKVPSVQTIVLLSKVLEVSVSYLLGMEVETNVDNSVFFLSNDDIKILEVLRKNIQVYYMFLEQPERTIRRLL